MNPSTLLRFILAASLVLASQAQFPGFPGLSQITLPQITWPSLPIIPQPVRSVSGFVRRHVLNVQNCSGITPETLKTLNDSVILELQKRQAETVRQVHNITATTGALMAAQHPAATPLAQALVAGLPFAEYTQRGWGGFNFGRTIPETGARLAALACDLAALPAKWNAVPAPAAGTVPSFATTHAYYSKINSITAATLREAARHSVRPLALVLLPGIHFSSETGLGYGLFNSGKTIPQTAELLTNFSFVLSQMVDQWEAVLGEQEKLCSSIGAAGVSGSVPAPTQLPSTVTVTVPVVTEPAGTTTLAAMVPV